MRSKLDGIRVRGPLWRRGLLAGVVLLACGTGVTPLTQRAHGTTPPVTSAPREPGLGAIMSVQFSPGSAELPTDIDSMLAGVAAALLANPNVRIQLIGYPEKAQDFLQSDHSHRLSLTRAMTLRGRLIAMGVPRIRMIVRLIVQHDEDGRHSNRVDIVNMTGNG